MIFKKYELKNAHSGVVEAYLYVPEDESNQSILFDFKKGFKEVDTPSYSGTLDTTYYPAKNVTKYMDFDVFYYETINILNDPELFHFMYRNNLKFKIMFSDFNDSMTQTYLYEVNTSYYLVMDSKVVEVYIKELYSEKIEPVSRICIPEFNHFIKLRFGSFLLEARIVKEVKND